MRGIFSDRRRWVAIFVAFSALVLPFRASAQQADDDFRWQTSKWPASDTSFRKIRQQVEVLRSQPSRLEEIIERHIEVAKKRPLTPNEVMAWGTALIVRSTGDFDFARRMETYTNLNPLRTSVYGTFHNDSFEFTRLRFVLCVGYVFPHYNLIPLGERLHKHVPNDLPVLRSLLILQQPQAFPAMVAKGRPYAEKLLRQDPHHISSILCAGTFFLRSFERTKNREEAKRGLALYEKGLRLSHSSKQRKNIQAKIDQVIAELNK